MSKKRIKQYLMLLTVVGLVAIAAGGGSGTFATFNAEVTNAGNTFAAGTLFLHDNGGATTCTSESSSDNLSTNNCDVLFSFGGTGVNNFTSAQTADLTLSNAGTIPASDIKFKVGSCVWSVANAGGSPATFGSAPADCSGLYVTIQEKTSNTFLTNLYCAFPDAAAACSAPSSAHTLANTTSLTTLKTTANATATFTASGGATDTRYYVITVDPSGLPTDNTMQNRQVTFDLTWHIDQ